MSAKGLDPELVVDQIELSFRVLVSDETHRLLTELMRFRAFHVEVLRGLDAD